MKMMKLLVVLALPFALASCASLMKSNFAKKSEVKGISQADIDLVDQQSMTFYGDYQRANAQGNHRGVSSAQVQAVVNTQMTKISNTYCNCVKKLGEKCQAKPDGLAGPEKDAWVKGNGAAEALELIQRSPADPMGCAS